jgi:hypothetical protein
METIRDWCWNDDMIRGTSGIDEEANGDEAQLQGFTTVLDVVGIGGAS